jgi:hypothetical protein
VVPVPGEAPGHEHRTGRSGQDGLVGAGPPRVRVQDLVLHRSCRHGLGPGPEAVAERVGHLQRSVVVALDLRCRSSVPPHRAHEPVDRERQLTEELREPPQAQASQELDLEGPLRGDQVSLRQEHVVFARGIDVRDSPPVPFNLDGPPKARDLDLALDGRKGGFRRRLQRVHPRVGHRGILPLGSRAAARPPWLLPACSDAVRWE